MQFSGVIEAPAGAGVVVGAEWDFEGGGDFPVVEPFEDATLSMALLTVTATHAFSQPGTYFPALRATVHREGDGQSKFARVQNLGRVRVVVE
jgi:hypothetical protein